MTIQTRLQPGMLAYVLHVPTVPNTVRAQPDTQAPKTGLLQPGVVMEILDNPGYPTYPVHQDGMIFWWVRSPALAQPGWTSEGDTSYFLAPVAIHPECAGDYPSRLHVGDLVLDKSAGGRGSQRVITDGPFCAAGTVVWALSGDHPFGSTAERDGIEPLVIHHKDKPWAAGGGRTAGVEPVEAGRL